MLTYTSKENRIGRPIERVTSKKLRKSKRPFPEIISQSCYSFSRIKSAAPGFRKDVTPSHPYIRRPSLQCIHMRWETPSSTYCRLLSQRSS